MEKVAIFLDYANLNHGASDADCEINYEGLLNYLASPEEGRFLQAAFAYVPIDPRQEHARDQKIAELWDAGLVVRSKVGTIAGQSYKCDFDVEMTLDMANSIKEIKPDIVVLISGDSDFVPVVLDMRSKGIRVEVAAFGNSISSLLCSRCSGFIDLDSLAENEEANDMTNVDDYFDEFNEGVNADNCMNEDVESEDSKVEDEEEPSDDSTENREDEECEDSAEEQHEYSKTETNGRVNSKNNGSFIFLVG